MNSEKYTLQLETEGRLTIPDSVRQRLGLEKGDRFILSIAEDNTIKLVSLRENVRKMRGMLKDKSPDRNLVDELIQERREEAASE